MLLQLGDVAGAEAAYRESLHLDPENADTHLQLGHALDLQGQAEAAEAAYLRAASLDRRPALASQSVSGNRGS